METQIVAVPPVHQRWENEVVKTTLEIPDPIFRKAKDRAAASGIPLRQFITDAVTDKLAASLRLKTSLG